MKKNQDCFKARALDVAVRSALISVAMMSVTAYAEDAALPAGPTMEELVKPTSHIELGGLYVSQDSFKQGEYNGLEEQGMHAIANVDLSGGGAYDSGDATRYRVTGTDLGLDTRRINVEYGKQGSYRINYLHDEQRRNYTDDYKTLWNGAGSDTLTLPAGYPAAGTRLGSTANANAALSNWNNIQAPYATAACAAAAAGGPPTSDACRGPGFLIPALMHGVDVSTKRTIDGVVLNWNIAEGWEARASYRHEEKHGIKLTGVNMNRFTGPSSLLPEPIDSSTNIYEATVGYANAKGHFSVGYNGSIYNNDTDMWTAQYAGGASTTPLPGNTAHMSGAPDNEMHQFTLNGGYNFTDTTRLVMSGAYTRMTQDENFLDEPASANWVLPEDSAHAKVNNSFFNAKLTTSPMDDLGLSFAYKYDYRNNKTKSHEFLVNPDTTSATSLFDNEPINRRLQQFNVDADYAFADRQGLNLGYEWQEIKRTADTEESPFRAEKTWENSLSAEYRNNFRDSLTGRVAYSFSQRRNSHYEENDPRPTATVAPEPAPDPLLPGFRQFFLADRNQNKLRGSLDFQATDALVLQTGLAYSRDDYNDSRYGVQDATNWTFNLDGDYAASESLTLSAFYSYENIRSKLESYAISRVISTTALGPATQCTAYSTIPSTYFDGDPCRHWSENQADHVHTLGVGFKSKGYMQGKLELSGDLAYSYAKTIIDVNGSSYYSNGAAVNPNVVVQAQDLPDVTTRMLDVKLNGVYTLSQQASVRVNYIYRHLTTADWQYDAYTNSDLGVLAVQGYIGPGINSPDYSVHMLGVSYVYNFK